MFRWFTPRCPIDPREKVWTERRMQWLARQFGIARLREAEVVLPTTEHFPDPFSGTADDVQRLLERVCRVMRIDPGSLRLRLHADEEMPGASGLYEEADGTAMIRLAKSQIEHPECLVATLAHELSHFLLRGGNLLTADEPDHEYVTDLLPVCLGLGVFGANTTVRETAETSVGWHYWSLRKQGYLPARIYGYALALFAWLRGEAEPHWADHLRLDARSVLLESLTYLHKTGDSTFRPDNAAANADPLTVTDLIAALRDRSLSARVAALWELADRGIDSSSASDAVARLLGDSHSAVRSEAATALAAIAADAASAARLLLNALRDQKAEVRASAALALGHLAAAPDEVIPELADLLEDPHPLVVDAAAAALRQYGPRAEPAAPGLLRPLLNALVHCNYQAVDTHAATLAAIVPAPHDFLHRHLADGDRELYRRAVDSVNQQRGQTLAARSG